MTQSACPVSVVIPAYNDEARLPRALEAVRAQSCAPAEVIVIDDGSTDATPDVARGFGNRVIYRRQENAGSAAARNLGITTATAEWVAFLDADDSWRPEHLQRSLAIIASQPSLAWCCAAYTRIVDGEAQPESTPDQWQQLASTPGDSVDFFDSYMAGAPIQTSGMVVKRAVLNEVGLFDPVMRRGQDRDLWYRIALKYPRMGFVWPATVEYIYNERSVTAQLTDSTERLMRWLVKNVGYLPELDAKTAESFTRVLRLLAREILWHALNVARPDCLRRLRDEHGWLLTRKERWIAWWGSRAQPSWLRRLSDLRRPPGRPAPVRSSPTADQPG